MVTLSMTLSDPDPGFKVTVVLKGEYLESRAFYTQSYYRTVIGNHMQAMKSVYTFVDLE